MIEYQQMKGVFEMKDLVLLYDFNGDKLVFNKNNVVEMIVNCDECFVLLVMNDNSGIKISRKGYHNVMNLLKKFESFGIYVPIHFK